MSIPAPAVTSQGPACPRCGVRLPAEKVRTGVLTCDACLRTFEATAFQAPQTRAHVVELAVAGPEGANACATHARNAAVTSCDRCGLFICSLCEMKVAEGSLCPQCLDRARADGTLQGAAGRIRDFASMARVCVLLGLVTFTFLGLLVGPLAIYYARKGKAQRRESGDSVVSMVVYMVLGALEALGSIVFLVLMVIGAMK